MKWLVPLGLLGLLGLVVLLIIYLIKPNFQKKSVSSTYVWKLSLKRRRRRNPINRLQDLILLICQILAITSCALIMAWPVLEAFHAPVINQKIAVIDGSISMTAQLEGETRFDRAIGEVRALAEEVIADEGEITVILAGQTARFIQVRATTRTQDELTAALDGLTGRALEECGHGAADVEGAMDLAEQILAETPRAEVVYYTGKDYLYTGDVRTVDISDDEEYNVAILNCRALLIENFYTFEVELASYGRDADITVYCEVYGANRTSQTQKFSQQVWLEGDDSSIVLFNAETTETSGVFDFQYVYIYIDVADSMSQDNMFYIYGGNRETIRVQYASQIPHIFFRGSIMSLRDTIAARWTIEYKEVNTNYFEPATEGFDFYIFERYLPQALPTDGVVMLVNPPSAPRGLGISLMGYSETGNLFLAATGEHSITDGVNAAGTFVSSIPVINLSEDYEVLLTCGRAANPAYAIRDDENFKMVIMPFELQNSTGAILVEFPRLFYQTFNYFFPSTVTQYNFEVGESVEVNARGTELTVSGQGVTMTMTELPSEIVLDRFGTYTLSQTLFNGTEVTENLYVKIPNAESDFVTPAEELPEPYVEAVPEQEDYDLVLFLAGALVLLLLAEWSLANKGL